MKVCIFSTHAFEKNYLQEANTQLHELNFLENRLTRETAALAAGSAAVSIFVNDDASEPVLKELAGAGIRAIALRSAGFNNVDLAAAKKLNIRVARVPAYSPYAVAEHTLALMLALNRKLIRANARVHDGNFSLDGLVGFDMFGKTAGVIGTGKIGAIVARLLHAFGCKVLAFDPVKNDDLEKNGIVYTNLSEVLKCSHIISLHMPLTADTKYVIRKETIDLMKPGVMLINTGRGALVHTKDVISALKSGKIGYLGLDVYEEEANLFFDDHSDEVLQDDVISRLLTFKNVLITSHQGFLTETALRNIAQTTIKNLESLMKPEVFENEIFPS